MTALTLLISAVLAPAMAASPELTLSDRDVNVLYAADSEIGVEIYGEGTLSEDSNHFDISIEIFGRVNVSEETVLYQTQLDINDDTINAQLSYQSGGVPIWQVSDSAGLSPEALLVALNNTIVQDADSASVSSDPFGGWSWPDGRTPRMIVEWMLEQLLQRDDVLIYVDGICWNCE